MTINNTMVEEKIEDKREYYYCPTCGSKHYVSDEPRVEKLILEQKNMIYKQ